MKSPFSYFGGKARISNKVIELIPKHTVYVEPFCGSATIMFKKPFPGFKCTDFYREVINDSNKEVFNFFQQLRDNGEVLVEKLYFSLYSEAGYKESCDFNVTDDLERARRFFINISHSFGHQLSAGWGRSVISDNMPLSRHVKKIDKLPTYIERMRSVFVSNLDALECIEKWDSPQSFFYCDPPYPGTSQGHYAGYSLADFQRLIDKLDKCQGSFMLSCYNPDPSIVIPGDWEKHEIETYCALSGTGKTRTNKSVKASGEGLGDRKRVEVIYKRQRKGILRPEIQKLFDSKEMEVFGG